MAVLAKPHPSLSKTELLQLIAGAYIQRSGFETPYYRHPDHLSETKLLELWAGALMDPDTEELILVPVGGNDPPVGGGSAPIGGGGFGFLARLFGGWFRALKYQFAMVMDY